MNLYDVVGEKDKLISFLLWYFLRNYSAGLGSHLTSNTKKLILIIYMASNRPFIATVGYLPKFIELSLMACFAVLFDWQVQ